MIQTERFMKQGYSFVCSCCERMAPTGENSASCRDALGDGECGGPLSGMSFPSYRGPLSRQSIASLCFRCGKDSTNLVEAKDGGMVGACDEHVEMLRPKSPHAMVPVGQK